MTVALRIGPLSSVDPDALAFAFDALKQKTPLESATLRVESRSRFGCLCQPPADVTTLAGFCPSCGAIESLADAFALDIRYLEFDVERPTTATTGAGREKDFLRERSDGAAMTLGISIASGQRLARGLRIS
jgi:Zn finger protein HypA/HybF involved in hydrogenase expression